MIASVIDILFGCWHNNYSFPITTRKVTHNAAAQVTGTYVVCLDCGREFPYDWKTMKVVSESARPAGSPVIVERRDPLVSKQAA
jgi:hypothetical protein